MINHNVAEAPEPPGIASGLTHGGTLCAQRMMIEKWSWGSAHKACGSKHGGTLPRQL